MFLSIYYIFSYSDILAFGIYMPNIHIYIIFHKHIHTCTYIYIYTIYIYTLMLLMLKMTVQTRKEEMRKHGF